MTEDKKLIDDARYFFNCLDKLSKKRELTLTEKIFEALNELNTILPVDASQILLLNEDNRLVSIVAQNLDKDVRDLVYNIGEGSIGTAYEKQTICVTGDLQKDKWNIPLKSAYEDTGTYREINSVISAGFDSGVLELLAKRKNWFGKKDIKKIELILPPLSLFIKNCLKERNHALDIVYGEYLDHEAMYPEYKGHSQRVAELAVKTFLALRKYECTDIIEIFDNEGLDRYEKRLEKAGLFHDIGKMEYSPEELRRTDVFNEGTINIFRDHPIHGYNRERKHGVTDSVILNGTLHHHQNYDGTGYPLIEQELGFYPLKERKIPFEARILRPVDVYDALTSDRPYRRAYPKEKAIEILSNERKKFDNFILKIFVKDVLNFEINLE